MELIFMSMDMTIASNTLAAMTGKILKVKLNPKLNHRICITI